MSKIPVDMTEKALTWLKDLPRVCQHSLRREPGIRPTPKRKHGQHGGKEHGGVHKGAKQRCSYTMVGWESGSFPFYLRFKSEPYYKNEHLRRQYPPLTLLSLQKFVDTDRINTNHVIDLAAIMGTGLYDFVIEDHHFGVHLTDEGANKFKAKVDIEVQWIQEPVIAAIEKNGGWVTMAYYDVQCLRALKYPEAFFKTGEPIPKRLLPPEDAIEAYSDPQRRGYLADPQAIIIERARLAQKYGYELVEREPPPMKDPRQLFFGLEPGWIVNLVNASILKPKDPELLEYYRS